jgi:CubicO group peptidase (beta-lactamase class C family)
MPRRTRTALALALLALPLAAQEPSSPPVSAGPDDPRHARADALLAPLDRTDAPGVLAAVVTRDGVTWHGEAGLANLSHGIPMTRGTRINVGSTAKTFTGYALARLHLDGVLSLDDDVRKWLPELPELGSPVTLRHLLTHTSGYRELLNALAVGGWRMEDGEVIGPDEALRVVQTQPALQNEPGAEWNYNNTGFLLLARVVESATGRPFTRWVEEEVFQPLGLYETSFRTAVDQVISGGAYGYRRAPASPGSPPGAGPWREAPDVGPAVGAGSLYTTLDDLATWMLALFHSGSPRWRDPAALMAEPFVLNDGRPVPYGLGLEVDRAGERLRLHHPGGDMGHQSHFAWFPEAETGVIVVANGLAGVSDLAAELTRVFLEDATTPLEVSAPAPDSRATTDDPASGAVTFEADFLHRLEGHYALEVDPNFILHVRRAGEGLEAQATGQPAFALVARPDTSFSLEAVGARLVFALDEAEAGGFVPGLVLHQGGAALAARRVDPPGSGMRLEDFVGRYHSEAFETSYTLRLEGEGLVLEHRRRDAVRLAPSGTDTFSGAFPFLQVTFVRDASGRVVGFLADAVRARDLYFARVSS